jgi:hypothetical protein
VLSVTVPVIVAVAAWPKSFGVCKHANKHRLNAETARILETHPVFT